MRENLINNSIKNFSEISFREERKGITLIALVITIVVLLILARNKYINVNRK